MCLVNMFVRKMDSFLIQLEAITGWLKVCETREKKTFPHFSVGLFDSDQEISISFDFEMVLTAEETFQSNFLHWDWKEKPRDNFCHFLVPGSRIVLCSQAPSPLGIPLPPMGGEGWAVVDAKLVERSLPTTWIRSSNPDISKKNYTNCTIEKTKIKRKRGQEWTIFK